MKKLSAVLVTIFVLSGCGLIAQQSPSSGGDRIGDFFSALSEAVALSPLTSPKDRGPILQSLQRQREEQARQQIIEPLTTPRTMPSSPLTEERGTLLTQGGQQCPTGSYPWTDNWGNRICKSFDTGGTTTIEGGLKNCPTGSYAWTDEWGNRICKTFESGQRYYDTSKGCPVGTYPWTDNWGNPVCKKF